MSDIRKRVGRKGTTYQVRYPSKSTKSGYAYATFNTMKEARAFVESGKAQKAKAHQHQTIRSVAEGIDKWLDVCEKEGRGGRDPVTTYTLKTYRYRAGIIKRYDWPKELHELTAPDIVEFRSWLVKNFSRDQSRKVLSYFHSMVLEMVNRGALPHDIAAGVRITRTSRYDERVRIPSENEVHALLAAADRLANSKNAQIQKTWERYRPMLYLAPDSGMRPQEYIALPRFNLRDGGAEVDRALDSGGKEISVTKTPSGRRFIHLSPMTFDMVTHYADNHEIKSCHDLVFPTQKGSWQSTNNWRRRGFQAACMEAGLVDVVEKNGKKVGVPKYKPYDLRHFYASMLIEQGHNLKRIQKLMGHADIQTTLNVYGHIIERTEMNTKSPVGLLASMNGGACGGTVAIGSQGVEFSA